MKYINKILALAVLWSIPTIVTAQKGKEAGQNTPAALELQKAGYLWMHTDNAAGLQLDNPASFTKVDLGYETQSGNFKKPQQGKNIENILFNAEGSTFLQSIYLWGSFKYSRQNIDEAGFNASLIDPYRGMPYYTVDTLQSNWNNQYYTLQMKGATKPLWNFVSFGLDLQYQTASGAKQRDPRSENQQYAIKVKPGVVFSITPKHHIGFNLQYSNYKEQSDMENANSYVNQTYYLLYGLGKSVEKIGSGRFTEYSANTVGSGLQYNYSGRTKVLWDANYSMKVEDLKENSTSPKNDGTTRDGIFTTNLRLVTNPEKAYSSYIWLGYQDRRISGIEYLTTWNSSTTNTGWVTQYKGVRSKYKTQIASAQYELVRNRGNEYFWKLGALLNYTKQRDKYLLPESRMESERLEYGVNGKVNIALSDKQIKRLLVEASATYNNGMSGKYEYGGQHSEYLTVSDLMQNEFNYSRADYARFNLSATYSQQLNEEYKSNLFIKGSLTYDKAYNYEYNHRSLLHFSIGYQF